MLLLLIEVIQMKKQQGKLNQQQQNKNDLQASGTEYHKEHASHVPDYGANTTNQSTIRDHSE